MSAIQGQSGAGMVPMHISKPRAANADMNDRPVIRGCIVSWHGLRYRVTLVRLGALQAYPISRSGQRVSMVVRTFSCSSVQVVTS